MPSETTSDDRLLVDARQVATMLGISLRHLRRLISTGEFPITGIRLGKCVRFPLSGPWGVRAWISPCAPAAHEWTTLSNNNGVR